ncbi:reverse transcriptase domain-containing protein [Rhizobium sp. Leaf391]|uniref:reverse transcriptase domain-containing protein n=1 Tax=Rhizobium sp. Leaf391 TaxID=1736360 RepID=UPI000A45EE65|nr:reverse transcriptase domain-containing protein [Rhizobium sp. Leaf391]
MSRRSTRNEQLRAKFAFEHNLYPGPIIPSWLRRYQDEHQARGAGHSGQPLAIQRNCALSESQQIALAAKNYRKAAKVIARLVEEGDYRRASDKCFRLLFAKGTALLAASKAKRPLRGRPGHPAPGLQTLAHLILSPAIDPQVRQKLNTKGAGYRATYAFNIVDRARQWLVRLAFGPLARFHDVQTGQRGRSALDAIRRADELIKDPKYKVACECDIKDFFGSVTGDVIARHYAIPEWVQREIVTLEGKENRKKVVYQGRYTNEHTSEDIQGKVRHLTQGSVVSPLLAYGLLRRTMERFRDRYGDRVAVVNNNDNFLLLGQSKAELEEAFSSLLSLLRSDVSAELTLVMKADVRPLSRGIDFLGYRLQRRAAEFRIRAPSARVTALREFVAEEQRHITFYLTENRAAGRAIGKEIFREMLVRVKSKLSPMMLAVADYRRCLVSILKSTFRLARQFRLVATTSWQNFLSYVERNMPNEAALGSARQPCCSSRRSKRLASYMILAPRFVDAFFPNFEAGRAS